MVTRVILKRVTTEYRTVVLDVDDYDYVKAGQRWINDHSISDFDNLDEYKYDPYCCEITPYAMEN